MSAQYSKGLKYKRLKGGGCALVGRGRCRDEEIVVPSKVFLFGEVISVFHDAFNGDKMVKQVLLPDTVKEINESAFYHCINLRKIDLPNAIETLGVSAFCGCKKLKTVTLPPSLKNISREAFALCDELLDINLENVKLIDSEAFYCCTNLKFVDLSNTQWLNSEAFKGCTQLDCIFISDKLQGIGDSVFDDTAYFMNKENWTAEGILYLDGWVLETTGENRPYVLEKNTKGRALEAFKKIYETKKKDNPNNYDYDEIFWAGLECGGYWDPKLFDEDPESREKYAIELIYPGSVHEWNQVKKWTIRGYKQYPYKIQTEDGVFKQEF